MPLYEENFNLNINLIVNAQLVSVVFYENDIQFVLVGELSTYTLSMLKYPQIYHDSDLYAYGRLGFWDILCSYINERVTEIEWVEDDYFLMRLAQKHYLYLSLKENDTLGTSLISVEMN